MHLDRPERNCRNKKASWIPHTDRMRTDYVTTMELSLSRVASSFSAIQEIPRML
jgi:hypothetical protein